MELNIKQTSKAVPFLALELNKFSIAIFDDQSHPKNKELGNSENETKIAVSLKEFCFSNLEKISSP